MRACLQKILIMCLLTPVGIQAQPAPIYTVVVSQGAPGGYYYVAPYKFSSPACTQLILDSTGEFVYYKHFGASVLDFKLQPNGRVTYFNRNKFRIMKGDMFVIDSVVAGNGRITDGHELRILPDGHYLLLGEETRTLNLTAYNYFHGNGAAGSPNATVTSAVIQELDTNKSVVFEWRAKDHFNFDGVDPYWLSDSSSVDWTHSNALELDTDGNILLSSRHFNEITKINRSTGAVMWRFGGKYNQFTYLTDTVPFYGQHDIRRLNNGHVSLFDNGKHFVTHAARALEYQLDEVNLTAKLVWSYVYDPQMSSLAMGNVQRLASGNTLVNYGAVADKICFNVVNPAGNSLFSLFVKDSLYSYRAFNFPELPAGFVRPSISCFDSLGVTYLDAGAGYASYRWSGGQNSRLIPVAATGVYDVVLPIAGGGFVRSQKINVTDLANVCLATAMPVLTSAGQNSYLYPNPASNHISINTGSSLPSKDVTITDIYGRNFYLPASLRERVIECDISVLDPGIYFVTISGKRLKFLKE
jgi:hypothetical protein